jgi:hypothetical protein
VQYLAAGRRTAGCATAGWHRAAAGTANQIVNRQARYNYKSQVLEGKPKQVVSATVLLRYTHRKLF